MVSIFEQPLFDGCFACQIQTSGIISLIMRNNLSVKWYRVGYILYIESISLSLLQKYIIDNRLLDSFKLIHFNFLNLIDYDLFIVVMVEIIVIVLPINHGQNVFKLLVSQFADIFVLHHCEEFEVASVV